MQKLLSKYWIGIVATILVLLVFNVDFFKYPLLSDSGDPMHSLDPSWQMMLNYALKHHYVWGKEIIYTYGPLGFLETRVAYGISPVIFLFFDVFVLLNLFLIFRSYIMSADIKWLAICLLFAFSMLYTMSGSTPWMLLFFMLYWMRRVYDKPVISHYAVLFVCITISLFIKLNTGLVGVVLFSALLLLMLVQRKIKIVAGIAAFAALAIIIFSVATLLNVSLSGYFIAASEIIKGYVNVMSIEGDKYRVVEMKINMLACLFIAYCVLISLFGIRQKKYENIFFAGVALLFIVLLRKQAISRNDWGHYLEFFSSSSLILFAGLFTFDAKKQKWWLWGSAVYIMLLVAFDARMRAPMAVVSSKLIPKKDYVAGVFNYKSKGNQADKRLLPLAITDQLKGHTVDIFPWDAACIIENNLHYKPRPMFQSFCSITEYLQTTNEKHMQSSPPDYILYDYAAIDGRYPMFDDGRAQLFVAHNYSVADTFIMNERWMLLFKKKNSNFSTVSPKIIKTAEYNFGDIVQVDTFSFLKIEVANNTKGKIKTIISRAPELRIKFLLEDGTEKDYKTSADLLKAGIFVGGYIDDNRAFYTYVNKQSLPKIKAISIYSNGNYFADKMTIQYCSLKF